MASERCAPSSLALKRFTLAKILDAFKKKGMEKKEKNQKTPIIYTFTICVFCTPQPKILALPRPHLANLLGISRNRKRNKTPHIVLNGKSTLPGISCTLKRFPSHTQPVACVPSTRLTLPNNLHYHPALQPHVPRDGVSALNSGQLSLL